MVCLERQNEKNPDFNIDPIIQDISTVLRNGLNALIRDFVPKHRVYEDTYKTMQHLHSIMNSSARIDTTADHRLMEKLISMEEKLNLFQTMSNETTRRLLLQIEMMNNEIKTLKDKKELDNECNIELVIEEKEIIQPEIIQPEIIQPAIAEETGITNADIVQDKEEEEDSESEQEEEGEDTEGDEEEEGEESESEAEEEDSEEEEEEEYFEIELNNVSYCTTDEENGFIFELTDDGVGKKIGYLKDSKPFFY